MNDEATLGVTDELWPSPCSRSNSRQLHHTRIDPAREETHYWGNAPADLRAIDIWIGEAADHERLGFKPVGRRRFGRDECLVYRLDRGDYA